MKTRSLPLSGESARLVCCRAASPGFGAAGPGVSRARSAIARLQTLHLLAYPQARWIRSRQGRNSLPAFVDEAGRLHIGLEFAPDGTRGLHGNLRGDLESLTNLGEDVLLRRVFRQPALDLDQQVQHVQAGFGVVDLGAKLADR